MARWTDLGKAGARKETKTNAGASQAFHHVFRASHLHCSPTTFEVSKRAFIRCPCRQSEGSTANFLNIVRYRWEINILSRVIPQMMCIASSHMRDPHWWTQKAMIAIGLHSSMCSWNDFDSTNPLAARIEFVYPRKNIHLAFARWRTQRVFHWLMPWDLVWTLIVIYQIRFWIHDIVKTKILL